MGELSYIAARVGLVSIFVGGAVSQVWVVRAGKGAAFAELAYQENVVGVGWSEVEGLPAVTNEEDLRERVAAAYPTEPAGRMAQWFGQLRAFVFTIDVGDLVLLPSADGSAAHVGEVLGPVVERVDLPENLRFVRPVQWIGSIERDAMGQDLLYTLQGLQTVFAINRGGDEERIRALASGAPDPVAADDASEGEANPNADSAVISVPRTHEMIHALAEVLASSEAPLEPLEAIELTKLRCPPTEYELSENNSGRERYTNRLRWWSVGLSKNGWMSKGEAGRQGQWTITAAGREALKRYPDADSFGKALNAEYKNKMREEKDQAEADRQQARLRRLLARIPTGRWASFSDAEKVIGWHRAQIGLFVFEHKLPGWHRLLRSDGTISAEHYDSDERAAEQRQLLIEDGLDMSGRAPAVQQVSEAELRSLLADELVGQRAWLVKGSSVGGRNLVPAWLADGYVSVPGTGFPALSAPIERSAIVKSAEAAFSGRASDYRRRKVDEYDRFLRLMQTGDLVVTTADGMLFAGRVMSEPEWVETDSSPSRIRRTVTWDLSEGVGYAELPEPLPERLQTGDDVADFSDVVEVVAGLIPDGDEDTDGSDEVAPATPASLELLEPSLALAERLYLPQDWLARVVQMIRRRKQIIFYGPPGTGKTFVAQELSEYLTDTGNVQVVQFHPSYAYEDFIQGFRPELSEGGQPVFTLRQGPLMKIAEKARDDSTTPYFLIIDEINRANLAKVFGELYFLLEYRKRRINTLYSEGGNDQFSLPDNLFIIGTMNTADRSIALVDAAMRRRFAFVSLHPDEAHVSGMLREWQARNHPGGLDASSLLAELNRRLDVRDYAIGPSYFMKDWIYTDQDGLAEVWESDIMPLLEEHHAGEDIDVRSQYALEDLLRSVLPVVPEVTDDVDPVPADPATEIVD